MKKTEQEIYNEAMKRGYCSPWQRGQFAMAGFNVSMLKLTEEVKKQMKQNKNKGKADYILDRIIGRC